MRSKFLAPLVAAIVGGGVVAGVLLATGVGEDTKTTTVIQQTPIAQPGEGRASAADGKAYTVRDIYKRYAPGVVQVRAQIVQQVESPFGFQQPQQQGQSTGSGFVVDKDGHIFTNAHVVDGASRVTVQFEDKKTAEAKIVGKDASNDLALLKVDTEGLDLRPLELGDSKSVEVGDPVIAIGNPFGLDRTLTTGVVSALQREIQAPDGFAITNVIQTDAAINPGNSGGPLLDAAGRVIGINSQIATGGNGNGNIGIGFAVPVNTAKEVMPQLKSKGRVDRAYLGITGLTIDDSLDRLNLASDEGVLVQTVQPGSPAAKAGIRGGDAQVELNGQPVALGGDIITKIDGKKVDSMDAVIEVVNGKKTGDKVKLTLLRDGDEKTVTVELGARPNSAPAG